MMFTFYDNINIYDLFLSFNLFYINITELLIFISITYSFWRIFSTPFFRKKFIFFFIFLVSLSIWGFYYSWDGWVCIMLIAELLIVLLFLLVWLTFKFVEDAQLSIKNFKVLFFIIITILYITTISSNYTNFVYNYQILYWFKLLIISSDFHVMFKFFFLDYTITVFFITLLLSLISIFFIGFYLSLKKLQSNTVKKKKLLHILRKQQMTKQANFKSQLRTFQL